MSWWRRLTGGSPRRDTQRQRVDYLSEALALERVGDYDGALTSYRLALRAQPNDPRILVNMGIAFSRVGQEDEAMRAYKRALSIDPALPGAHYGLAFLLLRRGEATDAAFHLESFLMHPPRGQESEKWIEHAREALDRLRNDDGGPPEGAEPSAGDGP
jgi:Flp pilus assembly protein TadD